MSFGHFLLILQARWKVAVLTLLIMFFGTLAVSLLLPKQYTATTSLVVDFKGMDPVLGIILPAQLMPGYMATQVEIIQSHKVAVDVVNALHLTDNAIAREQWKEDTDGVGTPEDWFADVLLRKLDVRPSRESNIIEIRWTGGDPDFAAIVVNAFATAYVKVNLALRVDPARQAAAFFDEQLGILRGNLEKAQARLNQYQRDKGYSSADERLDVENARLAELSAQYTTAQAQATDALSRQRQLADFLNRGANPDSLPDVLANSLVQNLKASLAASEARLGQTSSQLGANHPEVRRLKADIEQQRAKLKAEVTTASSAISNASRIAERRAAGLQQAVAEQKARLMRLSAGRDEMAVQMKEVESAQHAYEAASQRFMQTNLESQTSQTNVAILSRAIPPLSPSSPKLVLNALLSLVLGTVLGVGLAILLEMLDRRIRSVENLQAAFAVPVLGVLEKARVRKRRLALPWWRPRGPQQPRVRPAM